MKGGEEPKPGGSRGGESQRDDGEREDSQRGDGLQDDRLRGDDLHGDGPRDDRERGGSQRRDDRCAGSGAGESQKAESRVGKGGNSVVNRRNCEFQLLRYVPDVVRNEYVHIGVILREQGSREPASIQFTRDWRRVRCLDPEADTALLEGMESELRRRFREEPEGKLMRLLDESLSLNVQITAPKAYLAESLPTGMEELLRLYVEPPRREKLQRLRGRAAIQSAMRSEFERTGVWDLLRKQIPAAQYTRPGDPLRIDAGYRPNGVIKMFHAVSLEPGVEMAKILAFSASGLRAGVERLEKTALELTAVIEPAAKLGATDEEPERLEMYRFGVETMEEHHIRVLTTSDMGRVAETARRELRV